MKETLYQELTLSVAGSVKKTAEHSTILGKHLLKEACWAARSVVKNLKMMSYSSLSSLRGKFARTAVTMSSTGDPAMSPITALAIAPTILSTTRGADSI